MEPEYDEALDEAMDEYDAGQDLQDAQLENFETYSQPKEKSDLFSWFWRVTRLQEAFKLIRVGNLREPEIGTAHVSIRDAMNLAKLGKIFNHHTFAKYWEDTAGITSASSMAKKGWFMDLSISQKRVRGRDKKSAFSQGGKQGLFSRKEPSNNEE